MLNFSESSFMPDRYTHPASEVEQTLRFKVVVDGAGLFVLREEAPHPLPGISRAEASYLLNQEGLHTGFVLDFKPAAKLLAHTERQLREVVEGTTSGATIFQVFDSSPRGSGLLFQDDGVLRAWSLSLLGWHQLQEMVERRCKYQRKPEQQEQKRKKLKNSKKDKDERGTTLQHMPSEAKAGYGLAQGPLDIQKSLKDFKGPTGHL
ncbi:hypothetical protein AK812_SmicGene10378 [Symbiodinium microadriaticum]|uniref:Uncharacterized protein n=1 Tax=Symbiodinium microadriaticum TaxID=2951 RepID=A0A1Q9EFY6_SYMMI|nr:hypothetical protein AK812_SmicGene10378 [Symbiodinium microadriaticum]